MNRLHFSIVIKAPAERVWRILWDDPTYRDWTSVFAEGSYAVSDWNEGSKIQFLDPTADSGMSSIIVKKTPNEFMSFKHLAEIKSGVEQPPAAWSGALENYTLKEHDGATTLTVDLDAPEEFRAMFEDSFPKALSRVKTLAEK